MVKKRIVALEEELARRERTAQDAAQCMRDTQKTLTHVQSDRQAMKQENEKLRSQVHLAASGGSETLEELARLKLAREADLLALDEAQQVLLEVEQTEQRYHDVAEENERLRQDVAALQDDQFWTELESLRTKSDASALLFQEVRSLLGRFQHEIPSVVLPQHLLPAIDALLK